MPFQTFSVSCVWGGGGGGGGVGGAHQVSIRPKLEDTYIEKYLE